MTEQALKKYFIFQEGDEIFLVINAPPEEFDETTTQEFQNELDSRGFRDAIDSNIELLLQEADRGEILRIGGYKTSEKEISDADALLELAGDEGLPQDIRTELVGSATAFQINSRVGVGQQAKDGGEGLAHFAIRGRMVGAGPGVNLVQPVIRFLHFGR